MMRGAVEGSGKAFDGRGRRGWVVQDERALGGRENVVEERLIPAYHAACHGDGSAIAMA